MPDSQQPTLVEQLEYIAFMQNDANSPTLRMAIIKLDRQEVLIATIREAAEACSHDEVNFDIRVLEILDEAAEGGESSLVQRLRQEEREACAALISTGAFCRCVDHQQDVCDCGDMAAAIRERENSTSEAAEAAKGGNNET